MKSFVLIALGLLAAATTGRAAMFTGLGVDAVGSLTFSDDGRVAVGVQNNEVWRWSVSTGIHELPLNNDSFNVTKISGVSNDGSVVCEAVGGSCCRPLV